MILFAASFIDRYQALALFFSSCIIIWLFVWGGIKLWHANQTRALRESLTPLLTTIQGEQTRQAGVLEEIHHEVTFNNGSSVKDAVTAIRTAQLVSDGTIKEISRQVGKIDLGLERHLGVHEGLGQQKASRALP